MASWDKRKIDLFCLQKLLTAAENGNIKKVKLCVKNRANLECRDRKFGRTPLTSAAVGGNLEVVTYLVTHGSQLDAASKNGQTALHHAAEFGQIDVTKCLIDQGCSPWVKSKQIVKNVFFLSSHYEDNCKLFMELLDHRAHLNKQNAKSRIDR
ncbi:poly [ADP-ribose] polymerase tankyrase-1-like [Mytilus trossulus]|uniref:poly [ADP-ribose] polymerase tankyrase-1-like n=1 Tax=Mytilus trossulus TaxID=6551 RepID=UPI0030050443